MKYKGTGHFVCIGWSKKSEYAIKEVLSLNESAAVVLIDDLEKTPIEHARVHFICGDAATEVTMEMANVKEAKAVIIFGDEKVESPLLADGKTMILAASVEEYAPSVKTVVEVMKEEHMRSFGHMKIDDMILSNEIISKMAVRSSLQMGVTDFFTQVLSEDVGDNLYEVPKKKDWITYRDAVNELNQKQITVLGSGSKINVYTILDEKIPEDATIRIICNKETYRKI